MSRPTSYLASHLGMDELLYKPLPAPEPLLIHVSGNHLPALFMSWTVTSRLQGQSLENGKRDQEWVYIWEDRPYMQALWHWS